jgi:hypothetical protein
VRDLPVILDGYKLTIVEPPAPKMREDGNGNLVPSTDRQGARLFVVSLFAKQRVEPGQRAPKGEEIKVTLESDPGDGFEEDARVALIQPRINFYEIKDGERSISGIAFKAAGMAPAGAPPAPRGER